MKTCTKCGVTKELTNFSPSKLGRLGVASRCKECHARQALATYHAKSVEINADRRRRRREDPSYTARETLYTTRSRNRSATARDAFLTRQKAWNAANRDTINAKRAELHELRKDEERAYALAWYYKHVEDEQWVAERNARVRATGRKLAEARDAQRLAELTRPRNSC